MSATINEHLKPWAKKISDEDWPFPPKRMNVAQAECDLIGHMETSCCPLHSPVGQGWPSPLGGLVDPLDARAQDDPTGYPYPSEGV